MPLSAGFQPEPQPPRRSARRDRHGRGLRGATVLPGPLSPRGTRYPATAARRFDDLVLSCVRPLQQRLADDLGDVEFGVEETPLLPADWDPDEVPLATVVPATSTAPARIVLFRRPIEHRTAGRAETASLVLAVLIEQVAELLGRDPGEIDPGYEA
ncbi:MAG TPA: metallopeptidase family protein [Nocardioidaceae bacterium]|nr:metallopeptidase family protein [Nocardioidaceae bacterium]